MTRPTRTLLSILTAVTVATGLSVGGAGATSPPDMSSTSTDDPVKSADAITDLGEPVHKVQTLSSAVGPGSNDEPLGYYVVEGNPTTRAEFTVTDLRTNQTVRQLRVPYGNASQRTMGLSPVDGTVYFATSDVSHLYSYTPGDEDIRHYGPAPDGQRVWSMAVGADRTVWFGTYPGGRLYSLDPDTEEITNHGRAVDGEQYIKSIEPAGDTVYVGTESNARLAAYDLGSGTFTEIEMPAGHAANNIVALDLRDDLLFVSTANMHVLDVETGEWVDRFTNASARVSPVSPIDPDAVYLRLGGEINRYDLRTGERTPTGWRPNATPESWAWIDRDGTGPWLAMTYWNEGRTYGYNVETGRTSYQVPGLMGAGAQIISLGSGPDGNIYTGAYLSPPGMGRFDPDGDGFDLLAGSGQIEGYGTFGDDLVFGRYPQGSLYRYDPSRPWQTGTNPENPLPIGDEQSRPQAFVELTSVPGTVAVASVPTGGRHGGAITLWRPDEGTHEVFRHVVEDQTPVSLVEHGDVLLGGTSIEGGYGIDPVTDEGVLFAWDPVTGETLWSAAPVPGAPTISGLALDDDGRLWGIAGSTTVFEFDLDAGETVRTIEIDAGFPTDRYGNSNRLLFDHGRLFGSTANRLFVLDHVTGEVTTLYGGPAGSPAQRVQELAQDRHGDLYVVGASTRLLRYQLPADRTPPEVNADVLPPNPRQGKGVTVRLNATDDDDSAPTIHYRVDGANWAVYSRPVRLASGQTLEYRAIDAAWNSSPVESVVAP
ncbi:PQQ-binding-like beta-propeller repeat protein [Phytoactinopolyspora limicola]|uniref:PQQ-binding-like beta-propeller repeat protein n=1 Tax=Phytoactinopolyspora limicola TaxID=2715536 RepID=UPI00140DD12B|nr:PQQ-binding-like beta-propeller repeat protein [Phytoactinopolyspora limicola]